MDGVGVAALVLSLSLLSGFQDRIRAQMAERTPHLRVSPARGAVLPDPDRLVVLDALAPAALLRPPDRWPRDRRGRALRGWWLAVVAARRAGTRGPDGVGLFVVRAGAQILVNISNDGWFHLSSTW